MTGATFQTLGGLEAANLLQRLDRLQRGNLIKAAGDIYVLTFPCIIGEQRARLQKVVNAAAASLVPTVEKMVQPICARLAGNEQMLYHVLWSVIMDGPIAWQVASEMLKQQVKSGDISIDGKGWLVYPAHSLHCGTNTYSMGNLQLRFTHSPGVFRTIQNAGHQDFFTFIGLMKTAVGAINQSRDISETDRKTLAKYGLTDTQGKVDIFVMRCDQNNIDTVMLYAKLSRQFATELVSHSDIAQVAEILHVQPGVAFLILYHEICYELLNRLGAKGLVEIPSVVTKSSDISQIRRLVSVTVVPEGDELQRLMNMIGVESSPPK